MKTDHYGRRVPQHAHGTANLEKYTASTRLITEAVLELFDNIVNSKLLIRRVSMYANHVINEASVPVTDTFEQLELFTDYEEKEMAAKAENQALEREKRMQQAVLDIKKKYGKNAILKGMNLQELIIKQN